MLHSPRLRPGPRPYLAERYDELAALQFDRISVRPIGCTIGAEISGVDLGDVDAETLEELRRALQGHRVLFFRDQDICIEAHRNFASHFGELEQHPFLPSKDGAADVIRFQKDQEVVGVENLWHSDVSWRQIPSFGSVLRAVDVPTVGGDTLFSDMVAAYACLDATTRERIDGLEAVHDFTLSFGLMMDDATREQKRKEFPPATHPVVRTHPDTGERALYVNPIFTSHIVGMPKSESDALLDDLFALAEIPEYQCRFKWEKNSIAFWDNRMVQHYAVNDYWPRPRAMERITIIGEQPR